MFAAAMGSLAVGIAALHPSYSLMFAADFRDRVVYRLATANEYCFNANVLDAL